MSEINFNQIFNETSNASSNSSNINFFSLNAGQEAIVRFMLDKVEDFRMLQVHPITVAGKYRTINCLRTPNDNVDVCPFCKNGTAIKREFYIPMIQYATDNTGVITGNPVIWTGRSISMAKQLKGYLDSYGPLSEILCKITRKGAGLETEWNIIPNLSTTMYNPAMFPKMPNVFDNYDVLGRIVLNKNANEIETFIKTGNFPEINSTQQPTGFTEVNVPSYVAQSTNTNPGFQTVPQSQVMPWEQAQTIARPTRTF